MVLERGVEIIIKQNLSNTFTISEARITQLLHCMYFVRVCVL